MGYLYPKNRYLFLIDMVADLFLTDSATAWKVSKYGVISGPYFPAFELNMEIYGVNISVSTKTGKYGPEVIPYLDNFHAVCITLNCHSSVKIRDITIPKSNLTIDGKVGLTVKFDDASLSIISKWKYKQKSW